MAGNLSSESLFDLDVERREGPMTGHERAFEFYDRVKGSLWDDYRSFVNRCYRNLPPEDRRPVRGSWRGGQNDQLQAAWWELLLHEYLLISGGAVESHPLSDDGTRVDFQVQRRDQTFYLEAHRLGPSKESRSERTRRDAATTALDKARVTDRWRLHLVELRVGSMPLHAECWVAAVEAWLKGDEPDPGELVLTQDAWLARLRPVRYRNAGYPHPRAILIYPMESGTRGIGESARRALEHKVSRYPGLEPLVLAIELDVFETSDDDIMAALFGGPIWHLGHDDELTHVTRDGQGLFLGPQGPRNIHVAGVAVGIQTTPGDVERAQVSYWPNPWASVPVDNPCEAWHLVQPDEEGLIHRTEAHVDPKGFFGLGESYGTAHPFPKVEAWRASR